jgi:hypothetical protein
MNDEARLLFGLWEAVSDLIPTGDRQEAAANLIRVLIEQGGNDIDLLHDAEGECPYLDRALEEVAEELAEDADDLFDEIDEDE